MASNEFDDFDLGDFDNLDNFGADPTAPTPEKMKDDRNVVTTIATNFADGVKSTAFETQFIKNTMRKSLPDSYGKAADVAGDAIDLGRDLYDSAAKTLKPTLLQVHKTVKSIAPSIDDFLPKALVDKINDLSKTDSEKADIAKTNWEETEIASQLGDVFKTQAEAQVTIAAQQQVADAQKQATATKVNQSLLALVDGIRVANERLVGYQDTVTAKYQRKHLELTYRQYFATKNLLETTKVDNVKVIDLLQGVVKNTALPEDVKVNMMEMAHTTTKQKLVGFAQSKIGDYSRNFIANLGKNATAKANDILQRVNGNLQDALMLGDQIKMAQEMNQEMAASGMETGGMAGMGAQMAGGILADKISDWGAKQILKLMEKSPKVRRGAQLLDYGVDNMPELLSDLARSPTEDYGPRGQVIDFIKSIIPKGGAETDIYQDHLAKADSAAAYTQRTAKTINEIIPTYLSKILKSSEGIRTGGNPEREVYDFEGDRWSTESAMDQKIFNKMVPKGSRGELKEQIDRLIDQIDQDKTLSEDQRAMLHDRIIKDVTHNKGFMPKRFADSVNYDGHVGDREAVSELFRTKFDIGVDGKMSTSEENMKRINTSAAFYRNLSRYVPDVAETAFRLYNQGNQESLRRLGLIIDEGNSQSVNYDLLHSYYGAKNVPKEELRGQDLPDTDTNTDSNVNPGNSSGPRDSGNLSGRAPKGPKRPGGSGAGGATTTNINLDGSYRDLLQSQTDQIVSAIKDNRLTPEVREIVKLIQTVVTNQVEQGNEEFQKRAKTRIGRLFQSTGNFIGDSWGIIKSPLKGIGRMYGGAAAGIGNVFRYSGMGVGGVLGLGTSVLGGLLRTGDLWVKGRKEVALTKLKLKAGDYYDSVTGKTIKSWKDLQKLQGDIMDRTTNTVALTLEDIRTKGVFNFKGENVLAAIGGAVRSVIDFGFNRASGAVRFALMPGKAAMWIGRKAYDLAMDPVDVYIKDQTDQPKLYASGFKNGNYASFNTKKILKDWDDIDGPVQNVIDGNIVLTQEDLERGLVDVNNKPLTTAWQKTKSLFGNTIGLPLKLGKLVKNMYTRGFKFLGNMAAGLFSFFDNTIFFKTNKRQLDVIIEIRDMLAKKWKMKTGDADGDGIRDGSWQDKLKKKAGLAKDKVLNKENKERPKKGSGIIGGAIQGIGTAIVGGIMDKIGLGDLADRWFKRDKEDDKPSLLKRVLGWGDGVDRDSEQAKSGAYAKKGWLRQRYDNWRNKETIVGPQKPTRVGKIRDWLTRKRDVVRDSDQYQEYSGKVKDWVERKANGVRDQDIRGRAKAGWGLFRRKGKHLADTYIPSRDGMSYKGKRFWDHANADGGRLNAAERYARAKAGYENYVNNTHDDVEFKRKLDDARTEQYIRTGKKPEEMTAIELIEMIKRIDATTSGIADDVEDIGAEGGLSGQATSTTPTTSATRSVKRTKSERRDAAKERLARMRGRKPRSRFGRIGLGIKGALTGAGSLLSNEAFAGAKESAMGAVRDFASGHYDDAKDAVLNAVTDNETAKEVLSTAADLGASALSEKALATAGSWAARGAATLAGGEGLAAAGTAAMTWGGSAIAAAGSVLTAPVLLGAAAVAALGIGAYYGYKWFKGRLEPLEAVRFAQYGVGDDKEQIGMVKDLESELMDYVVYNGSVASLKEMKNGLGDLVEIFGIGPKDEARQNAWVVWFMDRFKPVFLTHLTVLRLLDPSAELDDVDDDLADNLKTSYLDKVKMNDVKTSPELVTASPFSTEKLPNNADAIAAAFKAAYEEVAKSMGSPEPKQTQIATSPAAANSSLPSYMTDGGKTALSTSMVAMPNTTSILPPVSNAVAETKAIQAKSNISQFQDTYIKRVDAVNAVKYKAYGLVTLEALRITTLRRLESKAFESITWGAKGEAVFDGSAEELFDSAAVFFNCGNDTDSRNAWISWFNNRFLPVFLNWCAGIRKALPGSTPLDNVANLEAAEMLPIAQSLRGATYELFGRLVSIWDVVHSPWPNYIVNNDPSTVAENINFIEKLMKDKSVVEQKARFDDSTSPSSAYNPTAQSAGFNGMPSMMNSWKGAGYSGGVASSNFSGMNAALANGGAVGYSGGASGGFGMLIQQPGKGYGGDINQIPLPQSDGSWEALKQTIIAASKMVGVDPGIMATMASIESNFRAGVSNKKSSASGLYQFIDSTWESYLRKYGAKYGIALNTPKSDPRANALMGAEFTKDNIEYLKKRLNRPITDADVYAAHFMGPEGAANLLRADPNADAVSIFPDAASANPSIFAPNGRHNTVGQVIQHLAGLVSTHSGKYAKVARELAGASGDGGVQATGTPNNVPDLLMRRETTTPAAGTAPPTAATVNPASVSGAFTNPGSLAPTAGATGAPSLVVNKPTTSGTAPTVTAPSTPGAAAVAASASPTAATVPVTSLTAAAVPNANGVETDKAVNNYTQQLNQQASVVDTQTRAISQDSINSFSAIVSVLNESLAVQQNIYGTLVDIKGQLGNGSSAPVKSDSASAVNPDKVSSKSLSGKSLKPAVSINDMDLPVSFKRTG